MVDSKTSSLREGLTEIVAQFSYSSFMSHNSCQIQVKPCLSWRLLHLVDISPWRRPGIRQNNVLFRFRFQFQVNYLNYNFNQISFNVLPNIDTSTGDRGFRASATFSCLLILFKRLCNPSFWFSNNLSFNFPLFTMTNNLKIRLICGTRGEYSQNWLLDRARLDSLLLKMGL